MATSVKVKIISVNHAAKTRREGTHFNSLTGISEDNKIIHFTENHGESTIHRELQPNNYYIFINITYFLCLHSCMLKCYRFYSFCAHGYSSCCTTKDYSSLFPCRITGMCNTCI